MSSEEKDAQKTKEKLEKILNNMDEKTAQSSSPFSFLSGGKFSGRTDSPASPAPKNKTSESSAEESEIKEKLKRMEEEIKAEKEKSMRAEILLKEKENARLEMENMFKTLKDQFRHEKIAEEMDMERTNARARVEILEKRLGEMNQMLMEVLKGQEKTHGNSVSQEIYKNIVNQEKELRTLLQKKEEEYMRLKNEFHAGQKEIEKNLAERYQTIIQRLESQLQKKEEEYQQFKNELQVKQTESEKKLSDVYQTVLRQLESQMKKKEEEFQQFKNEFQEKQKETEKNLSDAYQSALQQLESQMAESKKRIGELLSYEEGFLKIQAEKQLQDEKIQRQNEWIAELGKNLEDFRANNCRITEELLEAKKQISGISGCLDEANRDRKEMEFSVLRIKEERGRKEQELAEFRSKIAEMEIAMNPLVAENKHLTEKFKKKEEELTLSNENLQKIVQAKEQNLVELQSKIDQMEIRMNRLYSEIQQKTEKNRKQEGEWIAENEGLRQALRSKDQVLVELQSKVAEMEVKVSHLLSKNQNLAAEVEAQAKLKSEMESRIAELLSYEESIVRLKKEKEQIADELKKQNEMIQSKEKAVFELQLKVMELTTRQNALENEKASVEDAAKTAQNEMSRMQAELAKSQARVKELQNYKDYYDRTH